MLNKYNITLSEFLKKYGEKNNKVVLCETYEDAYELLEIADNLEFRWVDGEALLDDIEWEKYEDNTCYCFEINKHGEKEVSFNYIDDCIQEGYNIVVYQQGDIMEIEE